MGKLYLIVILLITRLSTHMRHDPFFFDVSKVGTTQGFMFSLIKPVSTNSLTCRLSQYALLSSFDNVTILVAYWMSRIGGRLFGRLEDITKLLNHGVTSKELVLSIFSSTSLAVRIMNGPPFFNSWSRSFQLIRLTPFVSFNAVGFCSNFLVLGRRGSSLIFLPSCSYWHVRSTVDGNIFVEEPWSSKDYLTTSMVITSHCILSLKKSNSIETKHRCFTSRVVELIHDTLSRWGCDSDLSPTFSFTLNNTALMQLSLFTITLQFLFSILVSVWKMTVLLELSFSVGCENHT